MQKKIAIYPGTFNPITNGHVDIIQRAIKLFDEVIVAVADSQRKDTFLSVEERLALATQALKDHHVVTVKKLDGLLVDFAAAQQAQFIVRGLRTAGDFDYEYQMANLNLTLNADIETVFLPASPHVNFISSTMVREIVAVGGSIAALVPESVFNFFK